jgi:hypothetical protein
MPSYFADAFEWRRRKRQIQQDSREQTASASSGPLSPRDEGSFTDRGLADGVLANGGLANLSLLNDRLSAGQVGGGRNGHHGER